MRLSKTDLVFLGLAAGSGLLCYILGEYSALSAGLRQAVSLLIIILPQLVAGLLIGGLVQQVIGKDRIAAWLGASSGLRGLVIATAAGAMTPGGPFTSFPIVYALWKAGAEVGALITYIAAWSLLGFMRVIVWELPLMGVEFTLVRILVSLPLPIVAGLLARQLSRLRVLRMQAGTTP
jgi:uncharacterized membrane protein YraQ (UPF0718 family)